MMQIKYECTENLFFAPANIEQSIPGNSRILNGPATEKASLIRQLKRPG